MLTLDPDRGLVVLEVRRATGTGWALPGTFLHEGETLADAVDRSLRRKANVRGLHPRQLHVFDDPDRDDRGWVLSVAHVEVVRPEQLAARFTDTTRLVPVHAPGRLPYDHVDIIALAVAHVRSHYADKPDPDRLLGDEFTLRELRLAHEAIAGDGACSATPSDVRWSRISSPLGKRRSAPEGVPQRCSGDKQRRRADSSTETVRRRIAHTGVGQIASRASCSVSRLISGRLSQGLGTR